MKTRPGISLARLATAAIATIATVASVAIAADAPPASSPHPAPATAPAAAAKGGGSDRIEDQIRARLQQRIGVAQVVSVRKMPFGLYEVVADNEVFYVDAEVNYLVDGRVLDVKTHNDLTASRKEEVLRVDFKSLPLAQAVKSVRGDGSRALVVFADPNCPYCKRLEKELQTLDNVTLYTFLYPILSQDSVEKSVAIWCAPDPAAAWNATMVANKAPHLEGAACKNPIDANLELGHKLQVSATPTLVFADGRRVPGAVPIDKVQTLLAEAARAPAASN